MDFLLTSVNNNLLSLNLTIIIPALITTWQQSHSPVGIAEYGHHLVQNGRVDDIAVGYQHFVHLTGCRFPYLREEAGERSVPYPESARKGPAPGLVLLLSPTVAARRARCTAGNYGLSLPATAGRRGRGLQLCTPRKFGLPQSVPFH